MKNNRYARQDKTKTRFLRFIIENRDIRKQFLVTLGLVLLHRLLINIPLPFLPSKIVEGQTVDNAIYSVIEFADMLSAGGLLKTSILGLGLLPFKLSDQILALLVELIPSLKERLEENSYQAKNIMKRRKVFLAIPLGLLQGFIFLRMSVANCAGDSLFILGQQYELLERILIVLLLIAGSFITYWISEMISEFGIKDMGAKVLVLCGIFSKIPLQLISMAAGPDAVKNYGIYLLQFILSLMIIIRFQKAEHRVSVLYPRRSAPKKLFTSAGTYIPMKVWNGGVDGFIGSQVLVSIATYCATLAICASSAWLREFAGAVVSFFSNDNLIFGPVTLISVILFAYLSSDAFFDKSEMASSLRKNGAYIPGVCPGKETRNFLGKISRKLSIFGGAAFGLLAILPWISNLVLKTDLSLLDGEKILIVVTAMIDLTQQLEAEMLMRNHRGFLG